MSSSTGEEKITHHVHKHPLIFTSSFSNFRCDVCGCLGSGHRYRCAQCDFDAHEHCLTCPRSLPNFFAHPQHPLSLVSTRPATHNWCDICSVPIKGMHYRCRPCGFDIHPTCTLLPVHTGSDFHPEHVLTLTAAEARACSACGQSCKVWRYRCSPCGVSLHPRCLHGAPTREPAFLLEAPPST